MKIIALVAVVLGEALVVFAEILGAKLYSSLSLPFMNAFLYTLIPLLTGAVLLVVGYMLGLKYLSNIWIMSAVSFGTLLLVEPLLNLFYIGQFPTLGAGIGFAFGVLGILAVMLL